MRHRKGLTTIALAGAFAVAALAGPHGRCAGSARRSGAGTAGGEAKSVRTAKTIRRVSLPRQPIREYEP